MLRALILCCLVAAPSGAETRALMEESFEVAQQGMASADGPLCQGSCPLLYFSSISQVGGIGR